MEVLSASTCPPSKIHFGGLSMFCGSCGQGAKRNSAWCLDHGAASYWIRPHVRPDEIAGNGPYLVSKLGTLHHRAVLHYELPTA